MTEHKPKAHLTYGNISIIDPARRIIAVPDGTLVQFKGTGVYVNSSRDDVAGQAHVTINTEDAPARDVTPDGQPVLEVSLNDATLYDREPEQAYVFAVVHVIEPRPGETVTEAWERTNQATVDGAFNQDMKVMVDDLASGFPQRIANARRSLDDIIKRGAPTKTLFATSPLLCPIERVTDPDFSVDVWVGTGSSAPETIALQPVPDEEVVPVPEESEPAPKLTAEHLRDAATIIEANEGGATYPAALARTLREVAKAMESSI